MPVRAGARAAARTALLAIATAAAFAPPAANAVAAPGQLDRSFGDRGTARDALAPHYGTIEFSEVAVEADGSLLVKGDRGGRRYSANGALLDSWPPRTFDWPRVRAVQPDGKVLEEIESGYPRRIKRLEPDGSPDESFNGGISESLGLYGIEKILALPSGKIVVAGTHEEGRMKSIASSAVLVRLNSDGTLDRGFGAGGSVVVREWDQQVYTSVIDLYLQPNEGLVAVGPDFVTRIGPDGSLDRAFADTAAAHLGDVRIVASQPVAGGGVTVAGSTCCGEDLTGDFFAARLAADGRPDAAYAGGGIARIGDGGVRAADAWFEADGAVAVVGSSQPTTRCWSELLCPPVPAAARFDGAGTPRVGFGEAGWLRLDLGPGAEYATDVMGRDDGGILVAGGGTLAFLAALSPSGGFESGFGDAGVVEESSPVPSHQEGVPRVVATPRRILVAVRTDAGRPSGYLGVAGYTGAGKIDPSYGGGDGVVGVSGTELADLVLGRSGQALVLTHEGELTRLTTRGALDRSFGESSPVRLGLRGGPDYRALAVRADGKILVAGNSRRLAAPSHLRVVRLLASGRPDPSFGRGGYAQIRCRFTRCVPAEVLPLANGHILLVGTAVGRPTAKRARFGSKERRNSAPSRIALVRLLPTGKPDPGFGARGTVIGPAVTKHSEATAAVLSRGGVLVAGWALPERRSRGLLARFRLDGSLDRRFARGGISRAFPPRSGTPAAVFPSGPRTIVALNREGPVAALAFLPDGRPDPSYRPPARPRLMPGLSASPAAALQGGRLLFAWTERSETGEGARTALRLTRLRR